MKRLRNALGESAEEPVYIETLAKRGYRFVGEVENTATAGPAALPCGGDHRRSPGRRFPMSQRAILNAGFTPYCGRLPAY